MLSQSLKVRPDARTLSLRRTHVSSHKVLQYSPNACDLDKAFIEELPSFKDSPDTCIVDPLCVKISGLDRCTLEVIRHKILPRARLTNPGSFVR